LRLADRSSPVHAESGTRRVVGLVWFCSAVCRQRLRGELAPACSGLALCVEVDGGYGEPKVVLLRELAGVEVVSRRRWVHRLPAFLPVQHEDEPVDAYIWPWAVVAHDLLPALKETRKSMMVKITYESPL
jgi:hypothetical protein